MTGESESVSRKKSEDLLVSVIIPVYQVSDYVERCLLSVMNQTYTFLVDNQLYNKEGVICEDLLWTFYLIKYLCNAQLSNDVTYYYHIRPDSILTASGVQKIGRNKVLIFNEMLQNLTSGKEKSEIKGYLSTFCAVVANYTTSVIELKPLIRLYKKKAKQYGCRSVTIIITAVEFVSHFCNPYKILYVLNDFRFKLKSLIQ